MEIRDIFGQQIENPDLERGELIESFENIMCTYVITQEGTGHYETIKEYDNGGKIVEWVEEKPEMGYWTAYNDKHAEIPIDQSLIPEDACKELEFPLYNSFYIYREYSPAELIDKQILKLLNEIDILKQDLSDTDYVILKVVEGLITLEDCAEVTAYRQELRNQINALKEKIDILNLELDKLEQQEEEEDLGD